MKRLKILEELKVAIEPYSFFWDEWIVNGDCNLTRDEIILINNYIKSDYCVHVFDLFEYYRRVDSIKQIIRKLDIGYQVFKAFVVVNFLCSVLSMAKEYGYDNFMQMPIASLQIDSELKKVFFKFNAPTLRQLFLSNRAEGFSSGWMYRCIVEFQIVNKTAKWITNFKSLEPMNREKL